MRIAILEDEFIVVKDLSARLRQLGYEVVATFSEGEALIAFLSKNEVDLLLVDIHLSGKLDGIETLHIVKQMTDAPAIFITAQADRETFLSAKEVKPAAYLIKPYNNFDLQTTIELAFANQKDKSEEEDGENFVVDETIFVRGRERFERILFADILYMTAGGNYTDIHTVQAKHVVTAKLGQLESLLKNGPFFRCHRSYMVNMKVVDGFDDAHIYIGEVKIPISKGSKRAFIEKLKVI